MTPLLSLILMFVGGALLAVGVVCALIVALSYGIGELRDAPPGLWPMLGLGAVLLVAGLALRSLA